MSETVTALKGTELPSSKSPVHEQGLWATPVSQTLGGGRAAMRVAVLLLPELLWAGSCCRGLASASSSSLLTWAWRRLPG